MKLFEEKHNVGLGAAGLVSPAGRSIKMAVSLTSCQTALIKTLKTSMWLSGSV